jgi:peptidoglycan/LPS O-acetylase OafA/YrhL
MVPLSYRPDIDGLRAFAVGVVVLFHAGSLITGGFIGVDIFFVISGFLITGIITKENDANVFSYRRFWARRIRRIVPALTVMSIAVMFCAFVAMLPRDYYDVGCSAAFQQVMLGNFYFWRTAGYFAGPSDTKPLLHTWSLAVEEQFYLIFPFIVCSLSKRGEKARGWGMAILFLVSLAISQYGASSKSASAFYLLPSRAWEMLLGAMVYVTPCTNWIGYRTGEVAKVVSLAVLVICCVFFDSTTLFPGFFALVPCAATAVLLALGANERSVTGWFLQLKPVVHLGKISYSLYLWHWPVLAFSRYWFGSSLGFVAIWIAIALSILLAEASYRWVESPLRSSGNFIERRVGLFGLYLVTSAMMMTFALGVVFTNGAEFRFGRDLRMKLRENARNPMAAYSGKLFSRTDETFPGIGIEHVVAKGTRVDFAVWGDSHAAMLCEFLDDRAHDMGLQGIAAVTDGVAPVLGFGAEEARVWNRRVYELLLELRVKKVLLVGKWSAYAKIKREGPQFLKRLNETISNLEEHGIGVTVVLQVPKQVSDPNYRIARESIFGGKLPVGVTLTDYEMVNSSILTNAESLKSKGSRVVDVRVRCFDSAGYSRLGDGLGSFYWDDDHLSSHGVKTMLAGDLEKFLLEARDKLPD